MIRIIHPSKPRFPPVRVGRAWAEPTPGTALSATYDAVQDQAITGYLDHLDRFARRSAAPRDP